jgi:putative transposase
MGRPLRVSLGGYVYHVLNRGNARREVFLKDGDYAAFERIMELALKHVPGMRLLAYCLMPNHWHLVLWPRRDGELSDFGHWLTLTHTQRWHAHYHDEGTGHLYQGRFKSFPVSADDHFLQVCRYAERNALRAGLVERAEQWQWGSLWRRQYGSEAQQAILSSWPIAMPDRWVKQVNAPQTEAEVEAIRRSIQRGRPLGASAWALRTAKRMSLESTLRTRGRPPGKRLQGSEAGQARRDVNSGGDRKKRDLTCSVENLESFAAAARSNRV